MLNSEGYRELTNSERYTILIERTTNEHCSTDENATKISSEKVEREVSGIQ